ncbi:MAG: hypothetical protein ACUVQ1_00245 [Candidatus Kapaibacteriales bacterium]
MSKKEELLESYRSASSIDEYLELARNALEEPKEIEVATEILNSAVNECKFPNEFIQVAEMFALLGDVDKAMELYEEAEDNSFKPLEFAQIAKSIFLSTKDHKKAFELFDQAILLAKKNTELLSILNLILQVSSDTSLLTKIVEKIVGQCKSLDEFNHLIVSITNESANKETLKMIFVNYERKIQGVENVIEFATLMKKHLEDETWAVSIVEECESEAKFTKEFIALAEYYNSLSQKEKTTDMLNQAQSYATSAEEYLLVGYAYWEMLQDLNMSKMSIEKAFNAIRDRRELIRLAEFSAKKLMDKDLTAKILHSLESKSSSVAEFIEFIDIYCELLGDSNKILIYYLDKQKELNEPNDLIELALDLSRRTSETDNVIPFFTKALENSSNLDQVLLVAEKAKEFGINDLIILALEKSEILAKTCLDFLKVGEKYFNLISSIPKAKIIFEKAEEYVTTLNEIKTVKEIVNKYFPDDKDWNERVEVKLKKRIEKQSEYDALQNFENELKFLVDYLNLADEIMVKLDDIYYCKKILQKAEKFLEHQPLSIENYLKLAQSILKHTNDIHWVKNIFVFILRSKINLLPEFEMFAKVIYDLIPEKEFSLELISSYLKSKLNETKDPNVILKIVKIYLIYQQVDNEIIVLLEKVGQSSDIYASIELLRLAKKHNLNQLFEKIEKDVFKSIKNSAELIAVCKNLVSLGVTKSIIFEQVKEFIDRTNKENDLITISENVVTFLNDKKLIDEIFKLIQRKTDRTKNNYFSKVKNVILEEKYW